LFIHIPQWFTNAFIYTTSLLIEFVILYKGNILEIIDNFAICIPFSQSRLAPIHATILHMCTTQVLEAGLLFAPHFLLVEHGTRVFVTPVPPSTYQTTFQLQQLLSKTLQS